MEAWFAYPTAYTPLHHLLAFKRIVRHGLASDRPRWHVEKTLLVPEVVAQLFALNETIEAVDALIADFDAAIELVRGTLQPTADPLASDAAVVAKLTRMRDKVAARRSDFSPDIDELIDELTDENSDKP
jgi:hypothetical protein